MNEVVTQQQPAANVSFAEALRFWLKLGFVSFGGPAGQIAIMHQELVERRRWISEKRFLHALNYCMVLPGPEAQQLATYIGWLMHKTKGGVAAGVLFVLPSLFILIGLSWVYVRFGEVPLDEWVHDDDGDDRADDDGHFERGGGGGFASGLVLGGGLGAFGQALGGHEHALEYDLDRLGLQAGRALRPAGPSS